MHAKSSVELQIHRQLASAFDLSGPNISSTLNKAQIQALHSRDLQALHAAFKTTQPEGVYVDFQLFNALDREMTTGKIKFSEGINKFKQQHAALYLDNMLKLKNLSLAQIRALTAKDAKFEDCKHLFKDNQDLYQLLEAAGDLDIPKDMQEGLRNIAKNDLGTLMEEKKVNLSDLLDISAIYDDGKSNQKLIHQILNHPRPGIIDSFSQKKTDYDAVVEEFKKSIAVLEQKSKDLSTRMEAKLAQLKKPIQITQPGESSTQLNQEITDQIQVLGDKVNLISDTLGENPKDNSYLASVVKELESQVDKLTEYQKKLQIRDKKHEIEYSDNGTTKKINIDTEALYALVLSGWDDSKQTLFYAEEFKEKWNDVFPEQSLDDNADLGAIHQAAADKFMDVLLESKSPAELEEFLKNVSMAIPAEESKGEASDKKQDEASDKNQKEADFKKQYIIDYMPRFLDPDKLNSIKLNDNKAYSALVSQVMASGDSASANAAIIARVTSARNKAVAKEFKDQLNDENITPKKLVELNKKYGDLSKVTVEIGRETKTYKDHIKAKAIDLAMQKLESIVAEPESDSDLTKNADARDKIIVGLDGDSLQSVLGKELSSLLDSKDITNATDYTEQVVNVASATQQKYVQHKLRNLSPEDLNNFQGKTHSGDTWNYEKIYPKGLFNSPASKQNRFKAIVENIEKKNTNAIKAAVREVAIEKLIQSAPAVFTQHEKELKNRFENLFSVDKILVGNLPKALGDLNGDQTQVFDKNLIACLDGASEEQKYTLYSRLEKAYKSNPQERINHAIQAIKIEDLTVEKIALITSGQATKKQLKIAFVDNPLEEKAKVDPLLIDALGNDDSASLTFSKEIIQQAQIAALIHIYQTSIGHQKPNVDSSIVLNGEQIKALHSRDRDSLIKAFSSSTVPGLSEGTTSKLQIPLELFKALEMERLTGKVKLSDNINDFKQQQAQAYLENTRKPIGLTLEQKSALVVKDPTYDGCKSIFEKNSELYSIFEAAGNVKVDESLKNNVIKSELNLELEIKNTSKDLTELMHIRNVYFNNELQPKSNALLEMEESKQGAFTDNESINSPLSDSLKSSVSRSEYSDHSSEMQNTQSELSQLLIYKVLSQPTPFTINRGYTPSIASMQSDVQRFYTEIKNTFDSEHEISKLTDNKYQINQMEQTAKNIASPPKVKKGQVVPDDSGSQLDIKGPNYSVATSKFSVIDEKIRTIEKELKASIVVAKPSHYLKKVLETLEAEKHKLQASINKVNKAAYKKDSSLIAKDVAALLSSSPRLSSELSVDPSHSSVSSQGALPYSSPAISSARPVEKQRFIDDDTAIYTSDISMEDFNAPLFNEEQLKVILAPKVTVEKIENAFKEDFPEIVTIVENSGETGTVESKLFFNDEIKDKAKKVEPDKAHEYLHENFEQDLNGPSHWNAIQKDVRGNNKKGPQLAKVVVSKEFKALAKELAQDLNSEKPQTQAKAANQIQRQISKAKTPRKALQTLRATAKNVAHINKAVDSLKGLSAASIKKEFSAEKRKAIQQSVEDYDSIIQKHLELNALISALSQPQTPVAKEKRKELEAEYKKLDALKNDTHRVKQYEQMKALIELFTKKIDGLEVPKSIGFTVLSINEKTDASSKNESGLGGLQTTGAKLEKYDISPTKNNEGNFVIKGQIDPVTLPSVDDAGKQSISTYKALDLSITLSEDKTRLVTTVAPIQVSNGISQAPLLLSEQLKSLAWQEAQLYISENGPPTEDKPIYLLPGKEAQSVEMNAYRHVAIIEICRSMKQARSFGKDTNYYNPDFIKVEDPRSQQLIQQFKANNPFSGWNHENKVSKQIAKQASQLDDNSRGTKNQATDYKEAKQSMKAVSKMFGTTSSFFKDTKLKYSAIREKAESKGNEKDQDNEDAPDHLPTNN